MLFADGSKGDFVNVVWINVRIMNVVHCNRYAGSVLSHFALPAMPIWLTKPKAIREYNGFNLVPLYKSNSLVNCTGFHCEY